MQGPEPHDPGPGHPRARLPRGHEWRAASVWSSLSRVTAFERRVGRTGVPAGRAGS